MMLDTVIPQLISVESASVTHILVLLLSVIFLLWGVPSFIKKKQRASILDKIPGPPTKFFLGNANGGLLSPKQQFKRLIGFGKEYGQEGIFRMWFGPHPIVLLTKHNAAETLVSSTTELHKSEEYQYIKPWLGNGLVTVNDAKKWHSHRKLLTPAFHFKILEDFLVVMNKQAKVMIEKLHTKTDGKPFDIYPFIKFCALDIISESAMGVTINAQKEEDSDYVQAALRMAGVVMRRNMRPWLRSDFIYKLTSHYKNDLRDLDILKGFTNNVIKERKEAMKNEKQDTSNNEVEGTKKRKAFLDLILSTKTADGKQALTDQEIQEEVDTFMFAGHDTTTTALSWFMFLMGAHPEIQEKVYEELMSVLGDKNSDPTASDLRELKYTECCIKEGLRLLPSVPFFGRKLLKDTVINGYTVPAGTSAGVFTYILHRDPEVWKDPETYNPDRFLTENISGLNPYAYIPFSAGPRNCIGQKFAQWEEKALISHIIRNFKISTDLTLDTIEMQGQVVLIPTNGIVVSLTPRD